MQPDDFLEYFYRHMPNTCPPAIDCYSHQIRRPNRVLGVKQGRDERVPDLRADSPVSDDRVVVIELPESSLDDMNFLQRHLRCTSYVISHLLGTKAVRDDRRARACCVSVLYMDG